jgi:hypothetical protein
MARLKDFLNPQGQFYEQPPIIVQAIEPADDVADSIMQHLTHGYQLMSITSVSAGPNSGRMLLLFQKNAAATR